MSRNRQHFRKCRVSAPREQGAIASLLLLTERAQQTLGRGHQADRYCAVLDRVIDWEEQPQKNTTKPPKEET